MILILIMALCFSQIIADDWPTYMHDAYRSGISAETVSPPLYLQWIYQARHAPSPAWPAPASKNLWVSSAPLPPLVAFDRASHVVSAQGKVLFGSSADDKVYCLDAATGRELWSFFTEGPVRFAPMVSGNRVYFGSDDGSAYCVDIATGGLLWQRRPYANAVRFPGNQRIISQFPVRTDVLVNDTAAYFCAGLFPTRLGAGQFSVNIATGNLTSGKTVSFSPQGYLVRSGDTILCPQGRVSSNKTVFTLAKTAVHREFDGATITVGGVQFKGGTNLVSTGDNSWSAGVKGKALSLAFASGRLFVSTDSGTIYCFGQNAAVPDTVKPAVTAFPYASGAQQQQYMDAAGAILSAAGTTQGYALVLDNNGGHLANALAVQSDLQIICVEPDSARAALARRNLDAAGVYGRVSVHRAGSGALPYADLLFNIVTFDGYATGGSYGGSMSEALRVLRPYGGTAFLGGDAVRKGPIRNAGEWTHYYCSPSNNPNSNDPYVGKDSIRMQWFGEPGPFHRVDRHARVASSLWKNGIMIVPGEEWATCVDAYNGTVLWELRIPGSTRLPGQRCAGYMALQDDYLYIASGNECLALTVREGDEGLIFAVPAFGGAVSYDWGHVAVVGDVLVGSAVKPGSFRIASTKTNAVFQGGPYPYEVSDYLFAYDRHNGSVKKWEYTPLTGVIANTTILAARGKVFFVESTNPENRAMDSCQLSLPKLFANHNADIVALDTGSGAVAWRRPRNFRNIERAAYMIFSHDKLIVTGCSFVGTLTYHLFAFDAASGDSLWAISKPLGENADGHGEADSHPVVAGDAIYINGKSQGFAVNIENGQPIAWTFYRDGWGCGPITASQTHLFYRGDHAVASPISENLRYPRPHLTTVSRSGCGINIIPAGGLINIPESSSGCMCSYSIQTSLAFLSTMNLNADTSTVKVALKAFGRDKLLLSAGHPNPFNASTHIRFSIPPQAEPQPFSLVVYNVRGQRVRTLAAGLAGREGVRNGHVQWQGTDGGGSRVGSGVYYFRLACGEKHRQGSIVMVK